MKTELLSPAGSLKNMRYAFAYGADAVYAGQPRYSLRVLFVIMLLIMTT